MNVSIRTFINPFSFFCKVESEENRSSLIEMNINDYKKYRNKNEVSDINHAEYVLVLWNEKWTRGIISMETQFLIWLVDEGFYLRPDDKTVFIAMPPKYRAYPTKIFEASIHGVLPLDKTFTEMLQITNQPTIVWNAGAVEKARTLIKSATRIHFVPVALLVTNHNDIVLGDLYLQIPDKGTVNLIDELQLWPVFLEKNSKSYIENLPVFYNNHRKHRACLVKPEFKDFEIPAISLSISLEEYSDICANAAKFEDALENSESSIDGSTSSEDATTVVQKYSLHKWTAEEIEEFAHTYITIYGRKYNLLNTMLNKLSDLQMCMRYRNHDLKSVGRANHRLVRRERDIDDLIDNFDLL